MRYHEGVDELSAWDYDRFEPSSFRSGEHEVSLERTGQVFWSSFDADPAAFCGKVVATGWEDFFREGVPPEVPDESGEEIRRRLEAARRPGSSTHLVFSVSFGSEALLSAGAQWLLDGNLCANPVLVGPGHANVVFNDHTSWRRDLGANGERMLVAPGRHVLRGQVQTRLVDPVHGSNTYQTLAFEHGVSLARGERLELVFHVAADGRTLLRVSERRGQRLLN